MPKLKSHSGTKKRFKKTGTGKIMKKKAGLRHLLTAKSKDRKRGLRKSGTVNSANIGAVKSMMPYS
jgi:large subunit ribosomal protein L35